MKVIMLSALRTGRLYPQEMFLVLIFTESTPGPWYGQKEYVTEKSSDTTGNRSIGKVNTKNRLLLVLTMDRQTLFLCFSDRAS